MPIYEYSCGKCHQVFEEWVRHIDDKVEQVCPACGAPAQRIVSNTSFVLKGGGWYVTDYGYRKGKDEGKSGGKFHDSGAGSGGEAASAAPAAAPAVPAAPAAPAASSSGGSSASVA